MDEDESQLALQLALKRWGTGFDGRPCCPTCPARTLWRRRGRLRVFGCSGCRREYSVTGGTWLHAAKLSLRSIGRFVDAHRLELPPSARAMARLTGHALSTSWSWSMRLKSAIGALAPTLHGESYMRFHWIRLRPNDRRTPAPHPEADWEVRQACKRTMRFSVIVAFMNDGLGHTATILYRQTRACVSKALDEDLRPLTWKFNTRLNTELQQRATALVLDVHRTVSERWFPRYMAFAIHQPRTPDPWLAVLATAPGGFARQRPGGVPTPDVDARFQATFRTEPSAARIGRDPFESSPSPELPELVAAYPPERHRAARPRPAPTARRISAGSDARPS